MPDSAIAEFGEQILSQVPLRRIGTPAHAAAVAAFLLADEAGFVTGSEYVVDSGMGELSLPRARTWMEPAGAALVLALVTWPHTGTKKARLSGGGLCISLA